MNVDKENLVEFCRDLIRIPSQTGREKEVVRRAQEELLRLGFDDCRCDDFGSVVGIVRGGSGPKVLLDAHLDTVGVEPISKWTHDPFGAWLEEGRLYGRGAADMKGPAAAVVYGAAALLQEKENLKGTVIVSLSTLEELCEGAALGRIIEDYRPDYIVIGEPSNLRLVRGQRGRAEIALTTYGVPAHSSTPQLGVDAVEKMTALLRMMSEAKLPTHPFLGTGVQALTDIISDPYPTQSTVPSRCRATFDRRLVVGEDESSIAAELHDLIETAKHADPALQATAEIVSAECRAYTGHSFTFRKFIPAWEMPADHELVRAAASPREGAGHGGEPPTHNRFFPNGSGGGVHAGQPPLGFGPADPHFAHSIDEYIEIEQLEAAAGGYAAIAMELLS